MKNQGIKENTIQLSGTIGDIVEYGINVNKNNPNLYLIISLIKTIGENPMELKLYYTHTEDEGITYGGMRLSDRRKIIDYETYLYLESCEGYAERYEYNSTTSRYESEESKNIIEREKIEEYDEESGEYNNKYKYTVKDKYGNKMIYDYDNTSYPNEIIYKNGKVITHRSSLISNGKGATIIEGYNGNSVAYLEYSQTSVGNKERIELSYTSNKLTEIRYYLGTSLMKTLNIKYGTTSLEIKDKNKNLAYKFEFEGYKVTKVYDGYIDTLNNGNYRQIYNITYNEDNTTKVEDIEGDYKIYMFDENDLLALEIDNHYNIRERKYEEKTNKLIKDTGIIHYLSLKSKTLMPTNLTELNQIDSLYITESSIGSEDSFLSYLGSNKYEIEGKGSLYKTLEVTGIKTDRYLLILPVKYNSSYGAEYEEDIKVSLTTYKEEEQIDSEIEYISPTEDKRYELLIISLRASKSYDKIKFRIETIEENAAYIGDAILIKKTGGKEYSYDAYQNLTNITSNQGKMQYTYNNSNILTEINNQGEIISYEYDSEDRLSKTLGKYNVETNYTYNASDFIETETIESESKTIETKYRYDSQGNVLCQSMKDDTITKEVVWDYDVEYFSRLNEVYDAISKTSYIFNEDGSVLNLNLSNVEDETEKVTINYTYENEQIKTINLENGTIYRYEYDNYKNIVGVYINEKPIVNITYNDKNQINSVKYPSDSKYFYFEYENSKLKTIKYGLETIKEYTYENEMLKKEEDYKTNITTTYEYDSDNQLIQIIENTNENIMTFDYDNRKQEVECKTKVYDYEIIKGRNEHLRASGGHTKEIAKRYIKEGKALVCFFDENSTLVGQTLEIIGYNSQTESFDSLNTYEKKVIPYVNLNANNRLYYTLNYEANYYGGICFWFKPTDLIENGYLFKVKYSYVTTSNLEVKYTSEDKIQVLYNNTELILMDNNIKQNEWNFFSLAWKNDVVVIHLNEKREAGVNTQGNIGLDNAQVKYYICHNIDNTSGYNAISCDFTGLIIAKDETFSLDYIYKYYTETKESLILTSIVENNTKLVSHKSVNHYDFNEIKNEYEIYPLNNSFNSINGKQPINLELREINLDNDRSFNYDYTIKRYAYVADGSILEYKFGNTNSGTIAMHLCQELRRTKQYMFYMYDSCNNKITLYTDLQGQLKYDIGSKTYSTSKYLKINTWYNIAFTYTNDFDEGNMDIRIVVDEEEYTNHLENEVNYALMTTIIGREKEENITNYLDEYNQTTYHPLYGLIEGLCYKEEYSELSTIINLFKNYKVSSVVYHYDELGRITCKDVLENNTSMLSNRYRYYQREGYEYTEETITINGNISTVRTYRLDSEGKVLNINDSMSTFGNHTYSYNYKGQLETDDGVSITYDKNGNISTYGTNTYTYDSSIPDRLIDYNSNTILYNTNSLYPNGYQNLNIEYEGNQISSISVTSNGESKKYTYKYNNGLRTHKYVTYSNGNTDLLYRYFYEGNRLISQYVCDIDRDDFLYDSNGLLYAMVMNKTDKYYYVRDLLQNIVGIIDSNGNLIVKYSYNAYGNVNIVDDGTYTLNKLIANRNPFRYKGYYLDSETGLFYCNSRYYNPEWGRWLTPDLIEYLEPDNINGLNLYAYCNNDPINYVDYGGHYPQRVGDWLVVNDRLNIVLMMYIILPRNIFMSN